MKKLFSAVAIVISCIILLFCSACGGNQNNDETNKPQTDICGIYLDDGERIVDGISIKISCSESLVTLDSENRRLKITFVFTNTGTNDRKIDLTNLKLLHMESGVIYDLSIRPKISMNLQYGIENTQTFSITIPVSYKKAEYVVSFFADKAYEFYLYERPDTLREDCRVEFVLNNTVIHTLTVKKGRSISEMYIWENPNHLTHCAEWFMDDKYTTELLKTTKINEDITVYGKTSNNIRSSYDSSGTCIWEIEYVSSDGIVVIPEGYMGGTIYISNFAIRNNNDIKEIYFPKGLRRIYSGNFEGVPNLQKIHFAGSEEEWKLIPTSSTIPSNLIMVYNSVFQN